MLLLFIIKRKTAYEMRISDWRSDVCSSDLKLGRAVVGLTKVAVQAGRGSCHHDATVILLAHQLPHRLRAMHGAHQVDIDHEAKIVERHLRETLVAQHAGIVDQDIDAAPLGDCLRDNRLDCRHVGHRRAVGDRPPTRRFDFRPPFLRPPRRTPPPPAARLQCTAPIRWTSTTKRKSSSVIFAKLLSRSTPALLTRISTRPHLATACATIASTAAMSVTDAPLAIASPPAASISATTACAAEDEPPLPSRAPPRSLMTSLAPRAASASACWRPRSEEHTAELQSLMRIP